MTLTPLLTAATPIPIHAMLAIYAIIAGGVQFARPKGTGSHRVIGYSWVGAMAVVAFTSFFINEYRWLGPFGPIHLLSCLVLYSLVEGIVQVRRGNVAGHRSTMRQMYFFALMIAGAFTFVPGRVMHQVVFGAS